MSGAQMLWLPVQQLLERVIARGAAEPARDMKREDYCDRAMSIWNHNYSGLVDEALKAMFHRENYANLHLMPHTSTNILRGVVEETCRVYQEPATRFLKDLISIEAAGARRLTASGRLAELLDLDDQALLDAVAPAPTEPAPAPGEPPAPGAPPEPVAAPPSEEPTPEQAAFDAYLAAADLDSLMQDLHRFARFLPAVWVMPVVRTDTATGKASLQFDIYTPTTAGITPNPQDATIPDAWWTWRAVPDGKGGTQKFRYEWTPQYFRKFDERGKQVPNDLAGDQMDAPNPLGRLPVTVVRLGRPTDNYYLDGQGGDLYDATLEVAVLRTLQNARFRDSSFKQLAIDGKPSDVPADQVMGNPAIPIYTGEGTAVVLDMQANLDQLSKVARERIEDIVTRYGISPSQWSMTERSTSGFSKKMDQAKVNAMNKRERKYLADAETDLYVLTARLVGTTPVEGLVGLNPEAEYVVDFAEPTYEEDPLTQARADSIAIKLSRTNYLELLMRDNPDLTEDEALAQLALNRMINERFGGVKPSENTLMDLLAGGGRGAAPPQAGGGFPGAPAPPAGGE